MLKEFKTFVAQGNVMDLAVGVIIGAAFGKIVSSLVEDVIMPPIGMLLGKVDFSNLFVQLGGDAVKSVAEAKKAGVPIIAYGNFLNQVVSFLIVGFVVFLMVRQVNRLKKEELAAPPPPAEPAAEELLLTEIRDLLKAKD